jgi:hypothetical protein
MVNMASKLNAAVRYLAGWQTSHDPELLNKSLNAVANLAADVVAVSKDPGRQKQRFYGFLTQSCTWFQNRVNETFRFPAARSNRGTNHTLGTRFGGRLATPS